MNQRKAEYDKIADQAKEAESNCKKTESEVLKAITEDMNNEQKRLCDYIYGPGSAYCKLNFPSANSYSFDTEDNNSTGFRYANLILHDIALLNITQLPCAIHDSLLFKNIEDSTIDKLMQIYKTIQQKQVFIAFDKKSSYEPLTQEILESCKVLELDEGTKALYGMSWTKRREQ